MFPDSHIVQCGAEAHSYQVDNANIKGHSVPYVERNWQNSHLHFKKCFHQHFQINQSKFQILIGLVLGTSFT